MLNSDTRSAKAAPRRQAQSLTASLKTHRNPKGSLSPNPNAPLTAPLPHPKRARSLKSQHGPPRTLNSESLKYKTAGAESAESAAKPQNHKPQIPKPPSTYFYRALGALVPYIVGTWGVREFQQILSRLFHNEPKILNPQPSLLRLGPSQAFSAEQNFLGSHEGLGLRVFKGVVGSILHRLDESTSGQVPPAHRTRGEMCKAKYARSSLSNLSGLGPLNPKPFKPKTSSGATNRLQS